MKYLCLAFVIGWSGAAYAATGTSPPVTVPITIPSSGPTPPAAAVAAGFTTLAANYDFSQSQWADNTTWLAPNTTATGSYKFYPGWVGSLWPGNHRNAIFQTTDAAGGAPGPVLTVHWNASDWTDPSACNSGVANCYPAIETVTQQALPGSTVIFSYPNHYVEVVARVDATNTTDPNHRGPSDTWSENIPVGGAGGCCSEIDFYELYNDGSGADGGPGNSGGFGWATFSTPNNVPGGWSETTYHKYGALVTGNGTAGSTYECYYIDDVFQYSTNFWVNPPGGCGNDTRTPSLATTRNYLIIFGGNSNATFNHFVQYVRIWSCATWATGHCDGSTLTSGANNLKYWY
jgi:hypothetical protein